LPDGRKAHHARGIEYLDTAIINRIEMLTTGIRTEIGIKIYGSDLNELERLSKEVASVVQTVKGASNVSPEPLTDNLILTLKLTGKPPPATA